MSEDTVECPYCGEEFVGDDEQDATTKEGIHRAQEHVNNDKNETSSNKGENIIDRWKSEGKKA